MKTIRTRICGILGYWSMYCSECGTTHKVTHSNIYNNTFCPKHYAQMKRNGKILNNTRFDKNEYYISECGRYANIILCNSKSERVDETIVDIEDLGRCLSYRIHRKISNRENGVDLKYAVAKIDGKNVRLHHLIMGDKNCDHINNNGLDNRKENLRPATVSKNGMNKRIQSNNSTGVVGVVSIKHNNTSPWMPMIKINNKTIRLGTEYSFDEAVKKRLIAEAELFKEHSNNYNFNTQTIRLAYQSKDDNIQTYIEVSLDGQILQFKKLPN